MSHRINLELRSFQEQVSLHVSDRVGNKKWGLTFDNLLLALNLDSRNVGERGGGMFFARKEPHPVLWRWNSSHFYLHV